MAVRYAPNQSAGKYTIKRLINTGNFAISYEAVDSRGKKVFLKQYKSPSLLVSWYGAYKGHQGDLTKRINDNPQLRERTYEFVDMYEHKNAFIQVYGFIEGGKDLKEYLEEKAMSPAQRYTFASLLLFTLKLFHEAGIVHTDLKPDNVYLMPKPEVRMGYNLKLIDFDFTVLDDKKAPWDRDNAKDGQNYCGTPRYMSPEHLRAEVPRAKSDVFTAAIICYELLTKSGHPFPEDEVAYKEAVLGGKFVAPDFIVSPDENLSNFGLILQKALSPTIDDRPTVGELQQALLKCRGLFTDAPITGSLPKPKPKTKLAKTTEPIIRASVFKLGLSMKGSDAIDWFKATSVFGSHSQIQAVAPFRVYCSGCQFVLRRESDGWYIDPAPTPPKNMVVYNGAELLETKKLSEGDIIALGSRKDPSKRDIQPMVVHLEEC